MKYKIVSDSSADLSGLAQVPYAYAPLHIIVDGQDFSDDAALDLDHLAAALAGCRRSSTACPSLDAWMEAFGDAEAVFCVTMTSALSGSHACAVLAKDEYEQLHPGRRVYVLDSLSTGPEMVLLIEMLQDAILAGREPEQIFAEASAYMQRTHLLFSLESLDNLARNGRVSPLVAKLAGLLGIRVVGQASEQGEFQLLSKCRGEVSALACIIEQMQAMGYAGGKVRIAHNRNEKAARQLMTLIKKKFKSEDVRLGATRGLCSYYSETGGLLVGLEC